MFEKCAQYRVGSIRREASTPFQGLLAFKLKLANWSSLIGPSAFLFEWQNSLDPGLLIF